MGWFGRRNRHGRFQRSSRRAAQPTRRRVRRPPPARRAAARWRSTSTATPSWPTTSASCSRPWSRWSRPRTTAGGPEPAVAGPRPPLDQPGRLPHPPRGRPRRHGRRLRGRAGLAGPARRPEGAAAHALLGRPAAGGASSARRKAAAKLHHTNIVPVFGVGEHDGTALLRHAVHPGPGPRRGARRAAAACGSRRRAPAADRRARAAARTVARPPWPARCVTGAFAPARARDAAEPATRRDDRAGEPTPGPAAADAAARRRSHVVGVVHLPGQTEVRPSARAKRADLLAERRPDRRAGGRRPGVRPPARASCTATSSRPTCCWTRTGTVWVTDFGLAKADDQREPDAHRRHPRHAALHAAGGVRGQGRRPRRRLLAWA